MGHFNSIVEVNPIKIWHGDIRGACKVENKYPWVVPKFHHLYGEWATSKLPCRMTMQHLYTFKSKSYSCGVLASKI
jgi:hypothetical protein